MKRLSNYIMLRLLVGICLSSLVLGCLAFISSFIRKIGRADHTFIDLLAQTVRQVPNALYEVLPLGCIIGTVIVLRSLASSNQLVMARCLGLSGWRLASLIATPAFLLGLVAIGWLDYVVVPMQKASPSEHRRVWIEDEQGLLYIERLTVLPTIQSENLIRFVYAQQGIAEVGRAEQLACNEGICRSFGQSYWGDPVTIETKANTLAHYGVPSRSQRLIPLWQKEKDDLEAWQLWQRIANPLLLVALVLLMGVFVLYSSPRASLVGPLVFAIGLGFLADTLLKIMTFSAMLYQLPIWLAFFLPLGGVIIATTLMIARKT